MGYDVAGLESIPLNFPWRTVCPVTYDGVNVGIVNSITMDYGSSREWGDAVIATADSTLAQTATSWPTSRPPHRTGLLGVTR
ncbi:hypothetical protein Raf01_14910 [Rugosimonospora africana]|uniref:Uncharacterized protein n=1 Tax=Rugosimonospora africana TaxID=556532 RepID=A0A8J3QLU1_9ACTN|nr:hypothetical protein Raf01_14910 [Rugosimonospora africana]